MALRAKQKADTAAIVPAAGMASRMRGLDKLFLTLNGVPVVIRTLRVLDAHPAIREIIIPTREDCIAPLEALCREYPIHTVKKIIRGGATRAESVLLGLRAASGRCRLAAIHDAARPFVSERVITQAIEAARQYSAAAPAVPVVDTVKEQCGGVVQRTLARDTLAAIQTPQVFDRELVLAAVSAAVASHAPITDDCSAVEMAGGRVVLTQGDPLNRKITTPEDLIFARAMLRGEEEHAMRIGHGYDVHRLAPERALILGGVQIPFELGLLGHSDADVLVHAVMDALLGAAALGDIGKLFPDTDERYAGADSIVLLGEVRAALAQAGFAPVNIDATVLAQRPKLAPFIEKMRANIAAALDIAPECVSVKATTEEKLGFTGAGEGIAAHAVCLVAPQ